MNSDEIVYTTVTDETKTPGARMTWGPKQCIPPMPYFTYTRRDGGELHTDNENHGILPRYRVTLFTEEPDDEMEEVFAKAVEKLGPFSRSWDYDYEHEAFATSFDFTFTGVTS